MNIKKLLASKGRAEIIVSFAIELKCFLFNFLGDTMTRVLAAGSVVDALVSFRPYSFNLNNA